MPEPFVERLSRFTPDAGGLDRDALLYAAGRASAHPNRGWIALTTALALAQPLFLLVWWPHQVPTAGHVPPDIVSRPASSEAVESPIPDSVESTGLWSVRHTLSESDAEHSPAPAQAVTFIESGPHLRAFAHLPPSMLN